VPVYCLFLLEFVYTVEAPHCVKCPLFPKWFFALNSESACAAGAIGLDVGPMSAFDAAKVDEEFFAAASLR
jgi:hypothetical protein